MPVAAQPLIDVFQGISASRQRAREKQAELSQQELERIAHEHYYEALARHQDQLDQLEAQKLKQEMDPSFWRNVQARTSQQRADTTAEKVGKEADTRRMHELSQEVQGAIKAHKEGAKPGEILNTIIDPEVADRFKSSVQQLQQNEYAQKKSAVDQQLQEQIDELHRTGGATGGTPGGGMFGPLSEQALANQLAPQVAKMTYEAHKALGEPPGPDDWMDYTHPAFREKQKLDDSKIMLDRTREKLMGSQEERNRAYIQTSRELANATINLKETQATVAKDMVGIRQQHENTWRAYTKATGDERIRHDKATEYIGRLRAAADQDRAKMAPYLQAQRELTQIALTDLRGDMREKGAIEKQVRELEGYYNSRKDKYQGYTMKPEQVGNTTIMVPVDAKGNQLNPKSPDGKSPSEADLYLRFKAVEHDLDKDNPDGLRRKLNAVQDQIRDEEGVAKMQAVEGAKGPRTAKVFTPQVAQHYLRMFGWKSGQPSSDILAKAKAKAREEGYE